MNKKKRNLKKKKRYSLVSCLQWSSPFAKHIHKSIIGGKCAEEGWQLKREQSKNPGLLQIHCPVLLTASFSMRQVKARTLENLFKHLQGIR
jgi:hypothetical protein